MINLEVERNLRLLNALKDASSFVIAFQATNGECIEMQANDSVLRDLAHRTVAKKLACLRLTTKDESLKRSIQNALLAV